MRLQYTPKDVAFWADVLDSEQTGSGFIGQPYQRGAGIGSFFRSLFRMAAPVLKRAAKAVGKQALVTGANVVGDLIKGGDVVQSLEEHGREAVANLAEKTSKRIKGAQTWKDLAVEDQEGGHVGRQGQKRLAVAINGTVKRRKTTKRTKQDIFD